MAAPWWLSSRSVNVSDDNGGGNWEQQEFDALTGARVYNVGGKYYYEAPRAALGNAWEADNYVPASEGRKVDDRGALKTATFTAGGSQPYGNLGVEMGQVDGKPRLLAPAGDPSGWVGKLAGDLGTYGGAQKAYWRSPSGAKGEMVTGPDGKLWVVIPPDATFGENDAADHSTMLGNAIKDFGPIVASAVGGGLLDGFMGTAAAADSVGAGMASAAEQAAIQAAQGPTFGSVLQSAATSAAKNAAVQLATTGDINPEKALIAGVAGGAASVAPTIDTGLPMPVNAGLLTAGTTAIAGGDAKQILTAGVIGAGANLANTGLINAGVPNAVANAVTAAGSAAAGGGDPIAAGFGSVLNSAMSDKPLDYQSPIDTSVTTVSTAPIVGTGVVAALTPEREQAAPPSAPAAGSTPAPASKYTFGSVLAPYTFQPAAWGTPPAFNSFGRS